MKSFVTRLCKQVVWYWEPSGLNSHGEIQYLLAVQKMVRIEPNVDLKQLPNITEVMTKTMQAIRVISPTPLHTNGYIRMQEENDGIVIGDPLKRNDSTHKIMLKITTPSIKGDYLLNEYLF